MTEGEILRSNEGSADKLPTDPPLDKVPSITQAMLRDEDEQAEPAKEKPKARPAGKRT